MRVFSSREGVKICFQGLRDVLWGKSLSLHPHTIPAQLQSCWHQAQRYPETPQSWNYGGFCGCWILGLHASRSWTSLLRSNLCWAYGLSLLLPSLYGCHRPVDKRPSLQKCVQIFCHWFKGAPEKLFLQWLQSAFGLQHNFWYAGGTRLLMQASDEPPNQQMLISGSREIWDMTDCISHAKQSKVCWCCSKLLKIVPDTPH